MSIQQVVRKHAFGATGMQVGALGFGAAEIGFEHATDQAVDGLLGAAIEAGINVIDTAAMYADSEEKIGRLLAGRRKHFLLFTKCGRHLEPARSVTGFRLRSQTRLRQAIGLGDQYEYLNWHPRTLEWNIEQSLRRLRTDCIDLIQLHSCSEQVLRQGQVIEVLKRARQAGKARHIGYTGDGNAARYALECGQFESVQISLNIADQQAISDTVPLAVERGVGLIAKRPIANGLWRKLERPEPPARVYWDRLQELQYEFLRRERAYETALRFTLSIPGVHTAIVGTTSTAHLLQNAAHAAAGHLNEEEFQSIRARWGQIAQPDWIAQE